MSAALGARMGARMSSGRRPIALYLFSSTNAYCCQPRFRFVPAFRSVRHSRSASLCNLSLTFDSQNYPEYQSRMQYRTGNVLLKKRKTEEERKFEKQGKKVIRYPPKAKLKNAVIDIWKNMTVTEIAQATDRTTDEIFESMIYVKNSESYDEESSIIDNPQVIQDILKICGYRYRTITRQNEVENLETETKKDATRRPPAPAENLRPRPPVVTVMGHVDHGKTTLLDSLRSSNVVEQEFGGITQHIGAFSVRLSNDDIVTFLDTPGHAAFSAMRARGANVTDMVVLVVAADDGVMEQTIESIRMAQEAKVPIIVAINKIDKPGANIETTKKMLAQKGIVVEDLGGDVQAVPISALKKTNLETLVEAIALQSQIMELKAEQTGLVEGVIIEAQTDPRRGKLATVLIQRGTLRKGCILVAGNGWARTRVMFSPDGSPISEATPSMAVQVLGWRDLPSAGDDMIEVESEKRASEVMRLRKHLKMVEKQQDDSEVIAMKEAEHRAVYEEKLKKKRLLGRYRMRREGPREKMFVESNEPVLHVVVKGDVDGSVEAILDVLETYDDPQCKLDIVHYGVGNVTESDVELAEAFKAIVYAFNIDCLPNVKPLAKSKNIKIVSHNVIYKMIDDIKEELNVRIPTTQKEEVLGIADVLQEFVINEKRKKVNVAGCKCIQGVLKKKALYKVKRGEDVIFEGKLDSMRHLKDEVDSIKKDIECGLKFIDKKLDFQAGDTVVCYQMVDVKETTRWNPGF